MTPTNDRLPWNLRGLFPRTKVGVRLNPPYDANNVVLTAIKKAEDTNALILRFYEWAGKGGNVAIRLPKGATSATMTNLMETPEGAPLQIQDGDKIIVPTGPYDIVTVKVSYPSQPQ